MKYLFKSISLFVLLLLADLSMAQENYDVVKLYVSDCKLAQTIKIYYLGEELKLVDSALINGGLKEELVELHTNRPVDMEEARHLISISPVGMDIDLIIDQKDTNIKIYLKLPEPNTEELYTTPVCFEGSSKAHEYYNLCRDSWIKSITVGKHRQKLLVENYKLADSLQVNWYNQTIYEKKNSMYNTSCLYCSIFLFYNILSYINTAKTYFGKELYNKRELEKDLNHIRYKYPNSKIVTIFLQDVQNDVKSINW